MSGLKNRKSTTNKDKNAKTTSSSKVADKNELKDPVETTSFDTEDKITKPILQDEPQKHHHHHHPHHEHDHDNDNDHDHDDKESTSMSRTNSLQKKTHSKKLKHHQKKKLSESRRVMFIFGALIGLILAALFTTNSESFTRDLDKLVNLDQFSDIFDDWKDLKNLKGLLPNGIQSFLQDKGVNTQDDGFNGSAESFSVGLRLENLKNFTADHNVVMVPGVISTGLESWGTTTTGDCPSIGHFRKRLWGSFYMLRTMVLDKTCWLRHIMLDTTTGLDPPNIKVRAAQGFEAADFFMAGYWIWNKILQNLAVIGYGPNNMISASYDWRLTYIDLEKRDGYFSKLKAQVEIVKQLTGKKSVLVGHSMGSQIIYYFLKWVEAKGEYYGNGGPNWVEDYVEAFVNISGSSLGTPKAIPALISGEMKDTVQLNALAVYGLEQFFSRRERVDMLRSFGGIASMIPKGGDKIWGNLTYAPDDEIVAFDTEKEDIGEKKRSFGSFIQYKTANDSSREVTIDQSIEELLENSPDWYSKRVRENYSFGVAHTKEELEKNNHDQLKWSNPLEAALPNAPSLKVYCFYGVGNPTERAYKYMPADKSTKLDYVIDADSPDGVVLGDGDGTVSLLTHTMCHEWQKGDKSRYNPANVNVTIVEIKHEPDRFDLRGGAKTAEHVDILGSAELNELVLTVAAGKGHTIQNRYVSNLKKIVENMHL